MAVAGVDPRFQTADKVAAQEVAALEPLGSSQQLTGDPRISARAQGVLVGAAVNQVSALGVQALEVGLPVEQKAGEILAKSNRTEDGEGLIGQRELPESRRDLAAQRDTRRIFPLPRIVGGKAALSTGKNVVFAQTAVAVKAGGVSGAEAAIPW